MERHLKRRADSTSPEYFESVSVKVTSEQRQMLERLVQRTGHASVSAFLRSLLLALSEPILTGAWKGLRVAVEEGGRVRVVDAAEYTGVYGPCVETYPIYASEAFWSALAASLQEPVQLLPTLVALVDAPDGEREAGGSDEHPDVRPR